MTVLKKIDYNEDKIIQNIYMFCDLWCERCEKKEFCKLYLLETVFKKRRKKKQLKGMQDFVEDVVDFIKNVIRKDFPTTDDEFALIENNSVYSQKINAEDIELTFIDTADKYVLEVVDFVAKLEKFFQEQEQEIYRKIDLDVEISVEKLETDFNNLVEAVDILANYNNMISLKIDHFNSIIKYDTQKRIYELHGTAKLFLVTIQKCYNSFMVIYNMFPVLMDDMISSLALIQKITREINEILPSAKSFLRPGFEDIDKIYH